MAGPLCIDFEGTFYNVMAQGNARADIFLNDDDRQTFLENLGRVCGRLDWRGLLTVGKMLSRQLLKC